MDDQENVVRYLLDLDSQDDFYDGSEARDKTAFLQGCSYMTSNEKIPAYCNLFDPVVTDLGICYSFNAVSMSKMLTKSSFKDTFKEVYKYDLNENSIENAKGAGDNFALRFLVYNNRFVSLDMYEQTFSFSGL